MSRVRGFVMYTISRSEGRSRRAFGALCAAALLAAAIAPSPASAQEGAWLVRPHLAGALIDAESEALDLDVGNALTAGVDVTYFATSRIAVNVLAAFISPEVDAGTGDEAVSLGSVDALPPVLTVQYHFLERGPVRPYVGGGGSMVAFFGYSGTLETVNADIETGIGPAVQGGVNLHATDRFLVMADVRWVWLANDPGVETDLGDDELDFQHGIVSLGVGFTL